jgi:endonuclease YncB( thermonuclease family)
MPKISDKKITKLIIGTVVFLVIYVAVQFGLDLSGSLSRVYTPVEPGKYRVTEVYDGDTFVVYMSGQEQKVRLVGVDTPETVSPVKPVQCYGKEASNFTSKLLKGRDVKLVADSLQPSRDKYDRLLRYVVLNDGRELNEVLVSEGYAFATNFNTEKELKLKALQRQAQNKNIGLWKKCRASIQNGYWQTNPI